MARQVLENGVILPAEYSDDWYDDMTSNLTKLDDVIGSDSEKLSSSDVGAAALSNNYNDLDNLPTIPTVNDATLTIQKNGVNVQTFTANASSNVTCNITVPTKTSDLTNDSNFVDTSNPAVASGITSAKVTDYDAHIADTDIHVTTADKNKWNNQTYVFRYSSTALVASSTNSNSLLDNTDNLKVGDKVIDSSGVLFSITAIDTANSTFTIGTALIDLAQDSDVVHVTGNETVGGIKSFSDDTFIKSLNFTNEVASTSSSSSAIMPIITTVTYTDQTASKSARINLIITASGDKSLYPHENNQYALGLTSRKWSEVHGVTYYYGTSDTEFSDKFVTTDTAQTISGAKTLTDVLTGTAIDCTRIRSKGDSQAYIVFRQSDQNLPGSIVIRASDGTGTSLHIAGGSLRPYSNNTASLGTSSIKWTDVNTNAINGLNPSSLSLPDLSNGIDISSYIDVSQTSEYTASSNGYISISGSASSTNAILIKDKNYGFAVNSRSMLISSNQVSYATIPVLANHTYEITCGGVTTIDWAYFYPCLGNV